MSRRSRKTMADDCCPEGARLRATQSAAWSIMIAASADAAAHEAADKAVRVAVEAYWAHRGAHGDSPWVVLAGALCLLYGKIAAHIEDHNARCQSITPCPACRMRELEAEVVRWRSGAITLGTPAPWHDPCDERIEAQ